METTRIREVEGPDFGSKDRKRYHIFANSLATISMAHLLANVHIFNGNGVG